MLLNIIYRYLTSVAALTHSVTLHLMLQWTNVVLCVASSLINI